MKIFLGNLSFRAEEADVQDFFLELGYTPSRVTLPIDHATGKQRGFAFIEFQDRETGLKAIEDADGVEMMGRALRVNEAEQRQQSSAGGRGRG